MSVLSNTTHPNSLAQRFRNDYSNLSFTSLALTQVPIPIDGEAYILVEADEDARVTYQNINARAARFNEEGNLAGVDGIANVEPQLVAMCLYKADASDVDDKSTYKLRFDKNNNIDRQFRVEEVKIKKWPGRIIGQLFDIIKDISELTEQETEEGLQKQINKLTRRLEKLRSNKSLPKKEQEDTGDTST